MTQPSPKPKKKKWPWIVGGLLLVGFIGSLSGSPSEGPKQADGAVSPQQEASASIADGSANPTPLKAETEGSASAKTTESYAVVHVVDGDTFDVEIEGKTERLRMIGIDTPETVDPRKPVQCFGKEASARTKELLLGQRVTLEADHSQDERDKYGRMLRYAFLPDGRNFGLVLIQEGYAHEYTYDKPYKYQQQFKDAERTAREAKKGLWADDACPTASGTEATPASGDPSPAVQPTGDGPAVKKSNTGKCHAKGTTYYIQTKNYTAYDSIQECLDSGGTLPR